MEKERKGGERKEGQGRKGDPPPRKKTINKSIQVLYVEFSSVALNIQSLLYHCNSDRFRLDCFYIIKFYYFITFYSYL